MEELLFVVNCELIGEEHSLPLFLENRFDRIAR